MRSVQSPARAVAGFIPLSLGGPPAAASAAGSWTQSKPARTETNPGGPLDRRGGGWGRTRRSQPNGFDPMLHGRIAFQARDPVAAAAAAHALVAAPGAQVQCAMGRAAAFLRGFRRSYDGSAGGAYGKKVG